MKAYIKVKKDYNSGLVVGHSQNMQKAISGFNELACEVVPYFSLDDVYNQITKEDIVVDYIQQCENVFAKFNVLNPHVDDYPECLRKFLGRKIWRDTINAISTDEGKWSAGCFVYYDQIIDVRPYKGDWHYNYDAEVLDEIMDQFIEWDKRPMACSIDIGVTKDGRTLLIECNDAYSLGAYGLVDYKYAKLLSARWSQLLEREDVFDYRKYQ